MIVLQRFLYSLFGFRIPYTRQELAEAGIRVIDNRDLSTALKLATKMTTETKRSTVNVNECEYGIPSMDIELDWGERVSFCVESIPEDKRQWLGEVIQRQVNEMLMRQRHKAVEQHKKQVNVLFAPQTLQGYVDDNSK